MDKTQEIKDKYKLIDYKLGFKKELANRLDLAFSTVDVNFFRKWEITEKHRDDILILLDIQLDKDKLKNNIQVHGHEQI